MKTLFLICLLLCSHLFADTNKNLFIIKDQNGKVVKGKKLKHTKNEFFDDLIQEQKVLLTQLKKLKSKRYNTKGNYNKNPIIYHAKSYLGGRYVWGGTKPEGFDCSGYVKYLYEKEGIELPRTAWQQSKVGKAIPPYALEKGDLVFFKTTDKRKIPITHVGMYIGNDRFIHAASKKSGIIISPLSTGKYAKKFVKATRIIK